jgi:hypothetical protein
MTEPERSIAYTEHAEIRMQQRGITPQQVAEAIEAPTRLRREGIAFVVDKAQSNGPWLRVVYVERIDATGAVGAKVAQCTSSERGDDDPRIRS